MKYYQEENIDFTLLLLENMTSNEEIYEYVNEIMKEFYEFNPTLNFGNINQRKAVEELIGKPESKPTTIEDKGKASTPASTSPALRDVESTAKALDAKKADIETYLLDHNEKNNVWL